MTNPKHGQTSTCRYCGDPIRLCRLSGRHMRTVRAWKHWPGPRIPGDEVPLHEAEPVTRKGKR